jgi:putative peptidoglycan lipid II flippase
MTLMTLLSRILGLVREQVRAHFLGTGWASDAYGIATLIPNLFRRLLAEGAMTAAFIPVFVEYMHGDKKHETQAFLSKFLTLLTLVAAAVTVLGILSTGWIIDTFFAGRFQEVPGKVELTIALTEWMWPYLFFVTLAAVLQAILNAHKVFGPSAFTPVLLNLAIIGCAVAFRDTFDDPAFGFILGFLVGGLVQIAFQVPYLLKHTELKLRFDFRIKHPGVRRVIFIMIPGVFAAGIYQINVLVSQIIAAGLEGGSIASLQYSVRLQELVLGLFVVSIAQVILPTLAEQTAKNDTAAVKSTLRHATGLMAFVTLPATAGLILIGPEVIALLFQYGEFDATSTEMTSFALTFHAVGLFAIAATRVFQQVFYAYKDMKTPTLAAFVVLIANVILCLLLSVPLSHGGIALAGSIAAAINGLLLLFYLRRKIGSLGGRTMVIQFIKVTLATLLMTAAVLGFEFLWAAPGVEERVLLGIWILSTVVFASVVYVLASKILRINELSELIGALRHRGKHAPGKSE